MFLEVRGTELLLDHDRKLGIRGRGDECLEAPPGDDLGAGEGEAGVNLVGGRDVGTNKE